MCVAFSTAKVLGINNKIETGEFVTLSPRDIYTRRQNQDSGGMWLADAGNIVCKYGATLDSMMPSDLLNETQARKADDRTNKSEWEALKYRGKGYLFVNGIDSIAQAITKFGSLDLCFRFNIDEWTFTPTMLKPITTKDNAFWTDLSVGHCITAVDFFMYNGKKAILVEDSWGTSYGKAGRRIITEDFINARCLSAMYITDLSNGGITPKPTYTWSKFLYFGMKADRDVEALQAVLKYEGLFPQASDCTGNYLEVTRKGVLAFQRKYSVAPEATLITLNGRKVGPLTVAKLNELYGKM
jgi:hypothetical protein